MRSSMRRKFAFPVVVLLAAGILAWQWSAYRQAAAVVPLSVASVEQYSYLSLLAKERGYFAKYGLEATVVQYPSGAEALAAIANNDTDVGTAGDFATVTYLTRHPGGLKILASMSKFNDAYRMVARKDAGITALTDLRGKSIGVTIGAAGEFFLDRLLAKQRLTKTDVEIVQVLPQELFAALDEGRVDAVMAVQPYAYEIERQLPLEVLSWPAQEGRLIEGLALASDAFLAERPDVAERYVRAMLDTVQYVRDHESEALGLSAELMGVPAADLRRSWNSTEHRISLDQALLLTLETDKRWILETRPNLDGANLNFLDYIHFDALRKASPNAVAVP